MENSDRRHLEKTRAWFAAHPDYRKLWYRSHKNEIAAYKRKYAAEHREEIRAYQKQWRAAHPDYNRAWLAAWRKRMKGGNADGKES